MGENNRVLVVDDDDDIREVMQEALVAEGFHVDLAKDGEDALHRLESGHQAPVILLDMMMPRMDGEAFLKALREKPGMADAPVVVISGNAGAREKASDLHAAACFVKPFELDELLSVVRRLTHSAH
jgi:chemosensory pili system protein ChpA (sensor histidine kinase/response regulator)